MTTYVGNLLFLKQEQPFWVTQMNLMGRFVHKRCAWHVFFTFLSVKFDLVSCLFTISAVFLLLISCLFMFFVISLDDLQGKIGI